jgi:hypothetical protein
LLQSTQVDDVNKISEFPLRVFEGYDTADKINHAFGYFDRAWQGRDLTNIKPEFRYKAPRTLNYNLEVLEAKVPIKAAKSMIVAEDTGYFLQNEICRW